MKTADVTYTYTMAWVAASVAVAAALVLIALWRLQHEEAKKGGDSNAAPWRFFFAGCALLVSVAGMLGGLVNPGISDDSKKDIATFMGQTYGLTMTNDEANRAWEDVALRDVPRVRGIQTDDGIRLVTFDDRFGQLRAYVYGTNNELPRLSDQ